jgi:hypothetical protein
MTTTVMQRRRQTKKTVSEIRPAKFETSTKQQKVQKRRDVQIDRAMVSWVFL